MSAITKGKGRARVAANDYYERCEVQIKCRHHGGGRLVMLAALLLVTSLLEFLSDAGER